MRTPYRPTLPNSSSARPPSAVLMRPQSLPPTSTPSPPRLARPTTIDPFVAQAHRIIRPSALPSRPSVPPTRVGSLTRRPSLAPSSYKRRPKYLDSDAPVTSSPAGGGLLKRSSHLGSTKSRAGRRVSRAPSSATSGSVYSTDGDARAMRRKGSVYSTSSNGREWERSPSARPRGLHEPAPTTTTVERSDDELLRHWTTFVEQGSPLVACPPCRSSPPQQTPSPRRRDQHALPRTLAHLASESSSDPLSPSPALHLPLSRVDSEVLSARFALTRLRSTEFAGDALDQLGRDKKPWWDDLAVMSLYSGSGSRESHKRTRSDESSTGSSASTSESPWKRGGGGARGSASTARTSLSIELLELDLAKFERELDLDRDEDEYVCPWDLIADDSPARMQRSPSSSSAESSRSTAHSRIPRPASGTRTRSSPPAERPTRSSVPPAPAPAPAPTTPTRASEWRAGMSSIPGATWARLRKLGERSPEGPAV